MRDFLLMLVLGALCVGAAAGWRVLNPPPPADYEIVYFGSTTCGACQHWKRTELADWRRDPASRSAPVRIAELQGGRGAFTGGYGRYHALFMETFGDRGRVVWPSFVLLNHGEVVRVQSGMRGWAPIAREVRREHARQVARPTDHARAG